MMGRFVTSGEAFIDSLSAYQGLDSVVGAGEMAVQKSLLRVRRKLAEEVIF